MSLAEQTAEDEAVEEEQLPEEGAQPGGLEEEVEGRGEAEGVPAAEPEVGAVAAEGQRHPSPRHVGAGGGNRRGNGV